MSLVANNQTLPPSCGHVIESIIQTLTEPELAVLVATDPAFRNGGFRPTTKAAILRARVAQIVAGPDSVSDLIRSTLAKHCRLAGLLSLLAPEALATYRADFAACFRPEVYLAALLLDPRATVRATAEGWLDFRASFETVDPAAAAKSLAELFTPLVELAGADTAQEPGIPATRERWLAERESLENKLRDARVEIRRLHAVDDRMAGIQQKLKTAEASLAATTAKLAETESALRAAKESEAAKAVELGRETAHREERLHAAVDLALAKEFHGWLAAARQTEAAAAAPAGDWSARIEAALTHQAEMDRASGNRRELMSRLDSLEAGRRRVADTLANAIHPLPELKELDAALGTEILRLKSTLGLATEPSAFEAALIETIHAADDNALPQYRSWPDPFLPLHLLDEAAVVRIREAYAKRLAAVQAVGMPSDEKLEESPKAVSRLSRALTSPTETVLLFDGHNVIFGLPARYDPPRGKSATEGEKRQRFVQDVVRLVAASPALRAWIVFDGPTRADSQAAPNVRVSFSGGTGEHRADMVLVDNVRFYKETAPEVPVLLVSDDQELCRNARRLGAETLGVLELGAFFPAPSNLRKRV